MDNLIFHLPIFNCTRCGHQWSPRKPEKPRRCAKCTALYYDRPARVPAAKKERSTIGRAAEFPMLYSMQIGDTILIPWVSRADGQPDYPANGRIYPAVRYHARKYSKAFNATAQATGLRVTRLA